jgi:1-deoxy-D-xylulose-5-phosphate reductoisomerase
LELIKENPDKFKVHALSCNSNIELLEKQIEEFKPRLVAVYDEEKADLLASKVEVQVMKGMPGLISIVKMHEADTIINSLVGSIGVLPTIEAIRHFKSIALANKETVVTAGSLVMKEAKKMDVNLMPIDSEHSAIWQCLNGEDTQNVNKIMITCSGGAFKHKTNEELQKVTADDALKHPTWNMGPKITIDCATLMNKGFEVIEAHWLYNSPYDKINVVIHPESVIHSLVEFCDHSVIAQLGVPSMKIPIQYALSYPKRFKNENLPALDLIRLKQINFKEPNLELFPCLKYAYDAGKIGGTLPAVMNAANEVAVKSFLENKIRFLDIPRLIKEAMDSHTVIDEPNIDEILEVDRTVKEQTGTKIQNE